MVKADTSEGSERKLIKASFIKRLNRFSILCKVDTHPQKAYLPNPGRLWELLLPGSTIYLEQTARGLLCWATERNRNIVMLHTHHTNRVAEKLIKDGVIEDLKYLKILRKEISRGKHRFDFLVTDGQRQFPLEVKSCTLFGKNLAMFPDAVTLRGREHIQAIAEQKGMVIFVVHNPDARAFLPDYHTDPRFSETLYNLRDRIKILPLAVKWDETLRFEFVRKLDIPWYVYEREYHNGGVYILIVELKQPRTIQVGSIGTFHFKSGFYLYVGSAMNYLNTRVERHKRRPLKSHWHIDYLTRTADKVKPIVIRTRQRLECPIASDLKMIFPGNFPGFGSSDCACISHLFYSAEDPLQKRNFIDLLIYYRIERLEEHFRLK